ncbi:MAG: universal stress protein [Myxococcota bacterium]
MVHIIGLDLRQPQQGPAAFATWLARTQAKAPRVCAVHVMNPAASHELDADLRDQLRHGARTAALEAMAPAELGERLEVRVSAGTDPERALADEAETRAARSIVIGRHAPTGADHVVRLGGVARRLLRTLPAPVVVVPPELTAAGMPDGPVVLATDGRREIERALVFATDLAESLRRPLLLAHVYPEPFNPGALYVPRTYVPGMIERYTQQQEERFERWRSDHDLGETEVRTLRGPVVPRLLDVAKAERACVLVTASRELSTVARLFAASTGSQLAATASCPVAVVPAR